MTTELSIPDLYPIILPQQATTIETVFANVPVSKYTKRDLTNDNYDTPYPKGFVQGGFISMDERGYLLEDAKEVVQKLASKFNRKFRLGTPFELVLYKEQGLPHPECFAALMSRWYSFKDEPRPLSWFVWDGVYQPNEFCLSGCYGGTNRCKLFIIEDL